MSNWKTMYAMREIVLITFFVAFVAAGCISQNDNDDLYPKGTKEEYFTFYASERLFQDRLAQRKSESGTEFTILAVEALPDYFKQKYDALKVTVEHDEGCDGEFDFIWDGAIMESHPRQVNLLLQLNAECFPTESKKQYELILNLSKFIGDDELTSTAIFHVLNGSIPHDGNDQNILFN